MEMLTAEEKAICQQLGLSEIAFMASKVSDMQLSFQQENSMSATEAREEVMKVLGLGHVEAKKIEVEMAKNDAANLPLTDDELKACNVFGVTPSEYYQAKQREAEGSR